MKVMKSWGRVLAAGALVVLGAQGCRPGQDADLATQTQSVTCATSQVPVMTSSTSPGGIVTRSGAFNSSYEAWLAFDAVDSPSSMWISTVGQLPAWIGYEWTDGPRQITRYAIRYANGTLTSRAPKAWTLQAWNGSQWVVVDTRTNEVNWGGAERRVYALATPATFSRFRLNVTEDNDPRAGIEVISMGRLELLGCAPDTTPPSVPVLRQFSPTPPSTTATPNLIGNAETGSTVRIFPNASCSGTPSVSTTAGTERLFVTSVSVNPNATTVFTATATDSSGNVSGCSQPLSYLHDGVAPAVPALTGFQPVSPSNSLTPQVRGTAEKGSTVQVFKGPGCVEPVLGSAVAEASTGVFSASVAVIANTTTAFSARALDPAGNASACTPSVISFVQDSLAPAAPVLTGFQPVSPSTSLTPQVRGTAETGGTVQVFRGPGCVAPVMVSALADVSTGAFTASVTVIANTTTDFSARVMDPAGNLSACATAIRYVHDGLAPPAPRFMPGFVPVEGNGTVGLVRAMGEVDSRIVLFKDAACTTLFSPSGPHVVGLDGTVAMALTVGQQLGPLFADARDGLGNRSACVPVPVGCDMGFADCDGNPANGCEKDLLSDEANCGACGTVCAGAPSAHAVCGAGTCGLGCVVGTFDCDGNKANGCESPSACAPLACGVDISSELMITDLSVVEDPVRTTGDGVWTFGHLLREMNGGQDPSGLVRDWLSTWMSDQFSGLKRVGARPDMAAMVLLPWENRSGQGASLDFNQAPFRLLAIVNRMDLRKEGEFAGEGRFVFGVTDPVGNPLPFTVILEYVLPGGSPDEIQRWARDWHELGRIGVGSPEYNEKLEALTGRFTKSFVARGAHLGSAIHQVRTNENALAPFWELREFHLSPGGLTPSSVALTPILFWDRKSTLADYVNLNMSSILTETHTVPEFFDNQPFLAGSSFTFPNSGWIVPGVSTEARHKFSLNTCSGCHGGETRTLFLHVHPRFEGQSSALSPFLVTSGPVVDPFDSAVTRSFADLPRRREDLESLVCGVPVVNPLSRAKESLGTSMLSVPGFPPRSNLPHGRVH
ncbi:hypothetical protein [Myxococcus landrumensis]|uniref:F5/8 type C domain-containing protein n=1 Tax=Myxococcus landrumensis TaxID=2813577 RepID=A0ABX7NN62_9BACT|nr:hypothetical protein [Myxococcus landrumus]QSQ17678.1 hypothetical protein JY572_17250 [Myxococcus landrumus]